MRVVANEADIQPPKSNNPPSDADPLAERLAREHADLLEAAAKAIAAIERMPKSITDDAQRHRAADFAADVLRETAQSLEALHGREKEPYLAGGRTCDRVLLAPAKVLREGVKRVERLIGDYLARRAEEERKAREAAAEAERQAAIKAAQEAEAAIAAVETDDDLTQALAKEEQAIEAIYQADLATQAAEAPPADLTRAHSTAGTLSSLKLEWQCQGFDRQTLNLEALRPYLPQDALEKAIKAFIRAGGRTLVGAVIREVPKSTIR